jgi:fumarate hydratase subunit alpha
MRMIEAKKIADRVSELAIKANISLRQDVLFKLNKAYVSEKKSIAKRVLKVLIDNAKIAKDNKIPICQDTGIAVVFCDIGEGLRIKGDINRAINDGIRLGYKRGFLRKSVVSDPFLRNNTGTNTPAVIHYNFTKGERLKITVLPKGFGSENACQVAMLKPTDGEKEILDFVIKSVKAAGPDACPPFILGIGIGGTLEKAVLLSKEATLKSIVKANPKKDLAALEKLILHEVNKIGIGPAGVGGDTTCLGVNILTYPTHIAGLPVCVNINCHAMRSATGVI